MAQSVSGASSSGGNFSIDIDTDNVQVASQVLRETCTSILNLGHKTSEPIIETAVEHDEQGEQTVRDIKPGSLHIRLRHFTDKGFLKVLLEYESGRMQERLEEQFLRVGIKIEGLNIENMEEVNKTREAINKRTDLFEGVEYRDEDDVPNDQFQKQSNTAMMKPLPHDETALFNEATSLGLLRPNPSLKKPRAKLLKCIHSSMGVKRSFNHVSILLVGISGAGKSATVNHLLQTGLAETNEDESETRGTKEYIIYGSDPNYEVEGLSLGLIDTPGFCDTDGSEQDACNLLSIHEFFSNHTTLSCRYANLILLLVKANDNRVKGENSDLGKSLRCIRQLGLVDPKNPNVVIVLTHACSIRKPTDEEWIKELKTRESVVSTVVFNSLKVVAPIVSIENKYQDCRLERCGDFTVLPNGELQPKNLYLACAEILQKNKDNLGLITLNSNFIKSNKGSLQCGKEFKAKEAKKCTFNKEEKKMVEFLKKAATGGFEDPIQTALWQYIKEQMLPANEIEEVMKIAEVLERLGEGNPPNFGSNPISNIEFDLDKDITPIEEKMLMEKFNLKNGPICELFESGSVNVIGQGYDILTDHVAEPVMKFNVRTKYGIAIPTCAKFRKVQDGRSFKGVYENETEYVQSRLKSLNLILEVQPSIYKIEYRAGYNKKENFLITLLFKTEYSFLFEQRLFELELGNYRECLKNGMTFTEDFKSSVAKLPSRYDKCDKSSVTKFKNFFDRFGHFVVSSAYGGGSVEVKSSSRLERRLEEVAACLDATLMELNATGAKSSADISTFNVQRAKDLLKQSTFSWEGGEAALQTEETIDHQERLQKWKESLLLNPVMLTSELGLEPISTAVGCIHPQKERATCDALKDNLESEIEFRVKKKKEATQMSRKNENTRNEIVVEPDISNENCFPSGAVVKVQNKDGEVRQKKMANLDVGDKVMGWDEKRNRTVFTKVMMFAHLAPHAVDVEYLKITLEDESKITLSGNHLVMVGKQTKAILARKVKPGDIFFSVDENQKISPKKVLAVEKVIGQGLFCPITLSGNVIVDNVLASCYASVEDHVLLKGLVKISAQNMAHLGLMPMRALHKLRSKWLRKIPNGQTIHPYLQWLCKLNHPCMVH